MDKIIVVDKPRGVTSYQVVRKYKRELGIKKIGHGGTLDPFATGVLLLLLGGATKRFSEILEMEKEYEMKVEFGWSTDTGDPEGRILERLGSRQMREFKFEKERLLSIFPYFVDGYVQQVPKYSAVKFKGKPLYKYARSGLEVDLPKKIVKIKKIYILDFGQAQFKDGLIVCPWVKLRVVCGRGTYMRRLAEDLGEKLGIPSVAVELRRVRVGKYRLKSGIM